MAGWDFSTVWVAHTNAYPTFIGYEAVDGRNKCKYLAGGFARKMVTTLSGLDHLEGQKVVIVQDGQVSADTLQTVSSGTVTLSVPAAVAHVGLPYTGKIQLLPLNSDGQQVNATKKRTLTDVCFRLFQSLGGKFGKDEDVLYTLAYGEQQPQASPLFTGDFHDVPFEAQIADTWAPWIVQDQPLPFMLLAAVITSDIEEKP